MSVDKDELARDLRALGEASAITDAPHPVKGLGRFLKRSTFTSQRFRLTLACLIGSMFGSSFIAITALGLIMGPLTATFHWNKAEISGAITLLLLLGAVMTAIWGRMIDRFGAKWIVIVGTLGVGLSTAYLSIISSALIPFYVAFAALGVCGAAAIGYTKMVGILFNENRGKALAIFGMESSIIGAIAPQLLLQMEKSLGWRGMFLALALAVVVATAIMTLLLHGLDTKAAPASPKAAPTNIAASDVGDPSTTIRKSMTFWLINFATMAGNLTFTGLLPHMVTLALSRGMTIQAAVTALSMQTLFTPLGQFAGGFVLDRVRSARVAAIPFAITALVGVLMIFFAPRNAGGAPWLLVGAAVLGFGNGAKRSMNSYFFTRYFGVKTLAETSGLSIAATAVVLAPAPLLFGYIFDQTKSYDLVLGVVAGGLVLATLCYSLLGPYRYTANAQSLVKAGAKA